MRAVVCRELRGPEALEVADLAVPEPGACGVRIRVRAAGVLGPAAPAAPA